jgi:hypothetical protein
LAVRQTEQGCGAGFYQRRFSSENWCRAWESNPHEENPHGILSPERLPFRQPGILADMQNITIFMYDHKGVLALVYPTSLHGQSSNT